MGHSCCNSAPEESRNKEMILCLMGGAFLFVTFILSKFFELPHLAIVSLYLISYYFCSYELISNTFKNIKTGNFRFDIDLLMALAAIGAAALGEWFEGALLLFLFSLAHALEHIALSKARNAIKALEKLTPQHARVLRDGKEVTIPVKDIVINDIVVVLPDERISVDGIVQTGESSVDQSTITGESLPVQKKVEDEVFAGSVNGSGTLRIRTEKTGNDRMLDKIIRLVEEAQAQKAPTQIFTDNFERIFVPLVIVSSALVMIIPPVFGLLNFDESFYRAMSLLVGASPCALALGTPSAVLAGIAQAARNGVLIKGGEHLESLGTVNAIAFDKTGTLTIGEPVVTDVVPVQGVVESEVLRVAAALENRSLHPLAKAVVKQANLKHVIFPEIGAIQSVTAKGVYAEIDGSIAEVGSLRLWESKNIIIPTEIQEIVSTLQNLGRSVIVVKHGESWLGVIGVRDTPRESAKGVIQDLRNLGIKSLIMLTGDNNGIGEVIGREVGVDQVYANLLPEDKVRYIKELVDAYGSVAMIGDGVNDAPALAHATVGISMGGAGTPAALETSDIALMADDLSKLPYVIGLSKAARKIIKQNLFIALFVIALLIVCTTSGIFGMGVAVFLHEGSTMVVVINSLRLLKFRYVR